MKNQPKIVPQPKITLNFSPNPEFHPQQVFHEIQQVFLEFQQAFHETQQAFHENTTQNFTPTQNLDSGLKFHSKP